MAIVEMPTKSALTSCVWEPGPEASLEPRGWQADQRALSVHRMLTKPYVR